MHLFQMTVRDFKEVIKEVILSIVPPNDKSKDQKIANGEDGNNEYLTREEAKNLLKVSYTTLWKYDKEGVLPAYKLGSRVYYLKSDIYKIIRSSNL